MAMSTVDLKHHWPTTVTLTAEPKYISAKWMPKEDITAYELARVMPYLIRGGMRESDWDDLGPAQRHWERIA